MKPSQTPNQFFARCCGFFHILAPSFLIAYGSVTSAAYSASATWNGTTDALWATEANWSASPVPGTGDTASFNNAGNGNIIIGLGSGVTVASILFDTNNAASYTIGSGTTGSQTLTLNHGGGVSVGAAVANSQAFNAALTLGTDRAAATYTIANDSASGLTFAGPIAGAASGGTAGNKALAVAGAGNTTLNGNVSKGGASNLFLTKSGAGTLCLNGTVTLTGGFGTTLLSLTGGEIDLGTSGQLALNATDNRAAGVAGRGTIRGGTLSNAGGFSSTGTLTIDSKVTSLAGAIGGTSNRTILTNADNSFSQNLRISSSTLEASSVGALGTGSSIAFGTANSGSGTLIYTGGSGTLNMGIIQGVNATTSGTITQSGTGALNITGAVTNQNTFNLTLNGSTSGTGELSGIISISSGSLTKSGTGTWTLSGTNTYTGRTMISWGVLSVAAIGNGGVPGNLGQASNTAVNLVLDGGTLRYTGADASTDRSFTLSAGKTSTIEVTANTLTMTGSVPASTGALTKAGNGTLVLAGPNSHSGGTTLSAGTLGLATPGAAGSGSAGLNLNGGTLVLATDTSVNSHPVNVGGATTVVADRATNGEGITHSLGKLTIGGETLSIAKGANVSGTATVTFADTVLTGNAVFEIPVGTTLVLGNITQSGGSFGITTTGGGSLVIDRNSSYTGNTNITDGILTLEESASLKFAIANSSNTRITGNGEVILHGGFTIDSAAFTGRAVQTWTLVDAPDPAYSSTFTMIGFTPEPDGITWTKLPLRASDPTWIFSEATSQLTAIPSPPTAYEIWSAGLDNPSFDFDSDNDGLANGLEWILGGDPRVDDKSTKGPSISGSAATGLTLLFNRRSETIESTTLVVEWGSDPLDLSNQTVIGNADVPSRGYDPSIDIDSPLPGWVTVFIPPANAVNGQLYARLRAYGQKDATGYDLFLLIGQSNMDGRGLVSELTPQQAAPSAEHIMFYHNVRASTPEWVPLAPGYATRTVTTTLPSGNFGCELSFSPAIAAILPGRKVAIVKASEGNTDLATHWNPGTDPNVGTGTSGRCYRTALNAMNLAVSKLPPGPHRLRGVIWHQGESDSGDSPATYESKLTNLINRIRADMKSPNLPFVIGELYGSYRTNITPAQQAVAAKVPYTAFVSSDGLPSGDGTHFTTAGQWELGLRYATAMTELVDRVSPVTLESHVVPTLRIPPSAYDAWASGLADPGFDRDADGDGIANGLEWMLGGNAAQPDSAAILPMVTGNTVDGLTLVFNRLPASFSESALTLEWGSDLRFSSSLYIGDRNVEPNGDNPAIAVDTPSVGKITVRIPAPHTSGGKLFARLRATRP